MKIGSVGAELFHADWQTDRHDEGDRRFSQSCEKRLKKRMDVFLHVGGWETRSLILVDKLLLIFAISPYPICLGNASVTSVVEYLCFCLNVTNTIEFHSLDVMGPNLSLHLQFSEDFTQCCKHLVFQNVSCWTNLQGLHERVLLITVNILKTKRRLLYLTLRRLMSYIYGAPILDVSRSHTTTQHSR